MLPLAPLLTASLLLQNPAAGDEASTTPSVPYPIQETVDAAEGDGEAILRRLVDGMGRDGLEELERIGFTTEYWNWRGPKLAYYEKFRTKGSYGPNPRGLVREATISPDSGQSQDVRFVVNEDDRFYVQKTTVSSSFQAEQMATHSYFNQLFLVLGPWLVERAGADVAYEGVATLSTFTPRTYVAPEEDGSGGFSNYEPEELRCHKLRVALPPEFEGANGPEAILWVSLGEEPRLVAFRSLVESRAYAYGRTEPIYHLVEWQEVGGIRVPRTIDMSPPNDAERQERIVVADVELDVEVEDAELRRP
ncbi:MAG: hypothetical protein ACF8XB_12910 [Planctomycetota bacterium JB042]